MIRHEQATFLETLFLRDSNKKSQVFQHSHFISLEFHKRKRSEMSNMYNNNGFTKTNRKINFTIFPFTL